MEELNEKKTKYFVIAIIILIILGVLLIVHFNNKQMVKGEENKGKTTTTTEKVVTTTTKKKVIKVEEVKEEIPEVVYKSAIDADNKLVYNYKLTEEITETDVLISKKLELTESLIEKNVIELYDISLYDSNLEKKNVTNSLITIKIPLNDVLKEFEDYKVVYINDKNEITDENFEVKVIDEYLEFNTTHLSMFGIIGTKKAVEEEQITVDLTKVTVDIKVNGEVVDSNNILLEKEDKVELVVNNIDENCNIYYGLRATGQEDFVYEKYDGVIELEDAINYKLFVKVSYVENAKSFEIGNIGLYDEVFKYDMNEDLEEDVVIGEIESEIEPPYDYSDKDKNMDIVVDNITKELEDDIIISEEEVKLEETSQDITTNNATISVNGNIYLVEKTDINKLQMTGHLYIDTTEDIVFAKDEQEKLELSNLYSLTIRSKEFMLNGDKYSYEYTPDGGLVIYLLEEADVVPSEEIELSTEEETGSEKTIVYNSEDEDFEETFTTIFAGNYEVVIDENEKDLIIEKVTTSEPEKTDETTENTVTEENQDLTQDNVTE